MESNFQTFIDFTRIARDQGYLEAAKELQRRKRETGMSFEQILREYDEIRASNQKSREEKIQLSGEVQRLKDHIAELKREEEAQYSQNNVSKEQVQKYLRIGDQLKRGGIDLEQQD
jgi:rubrerythrin